MKVKTKAYNKSLDGTITNLEVNEYEINNEDKTNTVKATKRNRKKVSKPS